MSWNGEADMPELTMHVFLFVWVSVLHSEVIVTLLQQRGPHADPGRASAPGHWALQTVILQFLAVVLLAVLIFVIIIFVHINLAVFRLKQQESNDA